MASLNKVNAKLNPIYSAALNRHERIITSSLERAEHVNHENMLENEEDITITDRGSRMTTCALREKKNQIKGFE